MTRILLLAALAVSVSACDLNPLMGKPSEFQVHQEQLAALTIPADEPEPLLAYAEPTPPPCYPVFRVTVCIDGVATDWSW